MTAKSIIVLEALQTMNESLPCLAWRWGLSFCLNLVSRFDVHSVVSGYAAAFTFRAASNFQLALKDGSPARLSTVVGFQGSWQDFKNIHVVNQNYKKWDDKNDFGH
jgi:hypothetical protein